MAICAVVYFLVQPSPATTTVADHDFLIKQAAIPLEVVEHRPLTGCEASQLRSPSVPKPVLCDVAGRSGQSVCGWHVSSMFLHGSIMHLLGNLLFFWIFGNNVEDRLGPVRFIVFYLVGGIVASMTHVMFDRTSPIPVVGASGAIAAVMGAYLVWWPRARVFGLVMGFFGMWLPAAVILGGWFVLQFFTRTNSGVAWLAHVGGFAFGVLCSCSPVGRGMAHHDPASLHQLIDQGGQVGGDVRRRG